MSNAQTVWAQSLIQVSGNFVRGHAQHLYVHTNLVMTFLLLLLFMSVWSFHFPIFTFKKTTVML